MPIMIGRAGPGRVLRSQARLCETDPTAARCVRFRPLRKDGPECDIVTAREVSQSEAAALARARAGKLCQATKMKLTVGPLPVIVSLASAVLLFISCTYNQVRVLLYKLLYRYCLPNVLTSDLAA